MSGTDHTHIDPGAPSYLNAQPELRATNSGQPEPKRSYFIRHWHGQLSLPTSYWVNSVLATVTVAIVSSLVAAFAQPTDDVVLWAVLIIAIWSFAILVSIWQFVGVWRSAGNHKGRGGSGFWAGVARFMVVLGCLNLAATLLKNALPQLVGVLQIVAGDRETGSHSLKILRDGAELEFSGGITFGVADEIHKVLDIDPSIKILHLNSPGGRVAEAQKLGNLIKERKLKTYTSTVCASACTIAFLSGIQRYAAPDARIGFHQIDFPGLTPQELAQENDNERRFIISLGVPAWFADRAYSTPSNSMWWPSLDTLKEANVITGVARAGDFGLSGLPRELDTKHFEDGLLQNPTLAAIKRVDPSTYAKILAAVMEAVKTGKSQAELNSLTMPFITQLNKQYLGLSSDSALMESIQILLAEIDAIRAKDPAACYRFINPQPNEPPVFVADYISSELMKRDLSASAAVIETGASNPQSIPSEAQVSSSLARVVQDLSAKFPRSDIAMLADINASTVDRNRACEIFAGFLREIMALPKRDQIALLRYLFAH